MISQIRNYHLIDYRVWILGKETTEGINLKKEDILTEKEWDFWQDCTDFLDQRNDFGHAEITMHFAMFLLKHYPGDRNVVFPAALLHDLGFYYTEDKSAWKKRVDSGLPTSGEEARRPHQNRGCLIAGRILERSGYPEKYHAEVADIIGDHDTMLLQATESGNIVMAADMLWRITLICMNIYRNDYSAEETLMKGEETTFNKKPIKELGEFALAIGRLELANTVFYKFGRDGEEALKKHGYSEELELIKKFYDNNK